MVERAGPPQSQAQGELACEGGFPSRTLAWVIGQNSWIVTIHPSCCSQTAPSMEGSSPAWGEEVLEVGEHAYSHLDWSLGPEGWESDQEGHVPLYSQS